MPSLNPQTLICGAVAGSPAASANVWKADDPLKTRVKRVPAASVEVLTATGALRCVGVLSPS